MVKWRKNICIAMSAVMMSALFFGCGDTSDKETSTIRDGAAEKSDSEILEEAITSQISPEDSTDADKEETVYVMADANGNTQDITVSTWLKNKNGSKGLNDKTNLTDIENVKGYEGYTENSDGTITWVSDGSDIYYQGKSNEPLPVSVKITYKLDGKEIEPSQLAGKSGKVTIRFDYKNNTGKMVKTSGRNREVISPFVMLSGMILPVDRFSNVQVENGKVISEGSNQIVVGYAVPGFKKCLQDGIDDSKIQNVLDDIDVPEYVEVTADVTDFELAMTMTVAASDLLDSEDDGNTSVEEGKSEIEDLSRNADKLSDSADELEDGSGKITNGLETLKDGTYSLKNGASSVANGADSLKTYTSQLSAGTAQISTAMDSLDKGIGSIKKGSLALNDGAKTLADGARKLDTSVGTLSKGVNKLDTGANTLLAGFAGVKGDPSNPGLSKGADNLEAGIEKAYQGSKALASGAKEINNGINTMVSLLTGMPQTVVSQAQSDVYSQLSAFGISDEAGIYAAMTQIEGALAMGPDAVGGQEAYNGYLEQYKALAKAQGALEAIDGIGTSLSLTMQSMNDPENENGLGKLTQGAEALDENMQNLSSSLGTLSAGAASISDGIDAAYAGTKTLAKGTGDLVTGVKALKDGSKSLKDGALTISTNMNTLYLGSVDLANGSGELKTAAATLDTSAGQIAEGAKTLSQGASQLSSGSDTLDEGANDLLTGSKTLSDGMKQFNEDGIKTITKLFAGNYEDDIDYIKVLFSDDTKYTTFGGSIEGSSSTVKFIYETGAIKDETEE